MSNKKRDLQSVGANPRDHVPSHHHVLKNAHKDWRVWFGVVLMLALVGVYVMTDNLSLRPGHRAVQQTPAANVP